MYEEIKSKKFCVPLALILNNFHNDTMCFYIIQILISTLSTHCPVSIKHCTITISIAVMDSMTGLGAAGFCCLL